MSVSSPLDSVRFLTSESKPRFLGECSAEVAFVGRSNVGKSTLINAVCRKALARTSNTPGRTRTINVFEAGHGRWLVDLPGYGYAAGPKEEREAWGPMIETYLQGRPNLKMVFCLVDAKVGPTKLDLMMLSWLEDAKLPWRVVATKTDQVKTAKGPAQRRDIAHAIGVQSEDVLWVSAREGYGVRELRGEVSAFLGL